MTQETVQKIFPVFGYSPKRAEVITEGHLYCLILELEKEDHSVQMSIIVPRPVAWFEGHPVFELDGTYKTIAYRAVPGPEFIESRSFFDMDVYHPSDVLHDTIRRSVAKAVAEDNPQDVAQRVVDGFFGTSELIRNVELNKPLSMEAGALTLVIDQPSTTRIDDYRYNDWEGIIDYITGTQGDKVALTFKLVEGVEIIGRRFVPSEKVFSSLMKRCVVFPENDRPNRLLITRPAFASHEELVQHEQPLVAHKSYSGEFKGRHLLTGILSSPDNYQDCIVISQSAARRLACVVRKRVVIADTGDIELLVQEGDEVRFLSPLALVTPSSESLDPEVISNPFNGLWEIENIDKGSSYVGGEPATRFRITVRSVYTCNDGDKLTTRHGGKGVVRVVPDHEMPTTLDGHRLEALVHPMSFNSRRNTGTFREMMLNKFCWRKYCENPQEVLVRVGHFAEEHSMEDLVAEGLGEPEEITWDGTTSTKSSSQNSSEDRSTIDSANPFAQLMHKMQEEKTWNQDDADDCENKETKPEGTSLSEMPSPKQNVPVFLGPLYWLRTDKHSRDQMTKVTGNRVPLSPDQLKPDSSRVSGKRMSMNYSTILRSLGLTKTHEALILTSMSRTALAKINLLVKAIK